MSDLDRLNNAKITEEYAEIIRELTIREELEMNCWHCKSKLIWGGDHTFEDYGMEGEGIVSKLSCPNCPLIIYVYVDVEVYYNIDKEKNYK